MQEKIVLAVIINIICGALVSAQTREPAVAGAFYPADPLILKKTVTKFVSDAEVEKTGTLIGLICPHAGYPYSGPVAGYSYKLLKGLSFDTVIILGANHRAWGFNKMSVWNKGPFKTPLGGIEIDTELADAIIKANPDKFLYYPAAHKEEHSIEVQLPFLQTVLENFKLVPIVMSDYSSGSCKELARAIIKNTGARKVLVIASTDLSHDRKYDTAVAMDKLGLDYAVNLDIENLIQAEREGKTEMCGYGPVLTLLYLAEEMEGVNGILLKYANSGDTTGNRYGRIVGYGAAAFYKEDHAMEYSPEEKKALLKLARDSITDYLSNGRGGQYPVFSEKFNEPRGVFVTLHKHGELRGCIGYIEPIKPLQQAVIDNAINSAVQDPRFDAVTSKELADIEIELSILTPPSEIKGPEGFIAGRHGIIIRKGFYNAVFLPQVATEQGWAREETLSHLCMKAGLRPDEWKRPGMRFFVFTAEVFSEKD